MKKIFHNGFFALALLGVASTAAAQGGSLTAVSTNALPKRSFYYSLQTNFPPSPVDPFPQLPLYSNGSGNRFFYDTTGFDVQAYLQGQNRTDRADRGASRWHGVEKSDLPNPPGGGGGSGDTNDPNPPIVLPVYSVTTNYGNYTNFWLAISNSSTQAFVSLMSTLPGLSYEIWTNSDPGVSNWAVWQVVTASNSVTPAPPLNIISNGNLAFAALSSG